MSDKLNCFEDYFEDFEDYFEDFKNLVLLKLITIKFVFSIICFKCRIKLISNLA